MNKSRPKFCDAKINSYNILCNQSKFQLSLLTCKAGFAFVEDKVHFSVFVHFMNIITSLFQK